MPYILSERLKINRPIIFLCGPKYEKDSDLDRRNIMRRNINSIYKSYNKDVLPLIVDTFLNEKYIDYNSYSVQLMEEICASISSQTHIFLDSISSAAELGMFTKSAYSNEINVYMPKESDIYNKSNIGYFVKRAVLENPLTNIKAFYYNPKISKVASSSIVTKEHYGFINGRIPPNIAEGIRNSVFEVFQNCDLSIRYEDSEKPSKDVSTISYHVHEGTLVAILSIKLLFYVVASLLFMEKADFLEDKKELEYEKGVRDVIELTKKTLKDSVCLHMGLEGDRFEKLSIQVGENDFEQLMRHIIKFIAVYYSREKFNAMGLVVKATSAVSVIEIGTHPDSIFGLSYAEKEALKMIPANLEERYERVKVKTRKKERELIKYADTPEGEEIKKLHRTINDSFRKKYEHSKYSFAYHKGLSIKNCVEHHINSNYYIKLDIKDYFGSISEEILVAKLMKSFKIDSHFKEQLISVVDTCFVGGKLPIGLTCSPIFSDFYLHDLDLLIGAFCEERGIIYTRYADDILLSSATKFEEKIIAELLTCIRSKLLLLHLRLNDTKTERVSFEEKNHVRYIGINIVKGKESNYLSVGKKYIHALAKDFIEYDDILRAKNGITEPELFYKRVEIIGKIGFIKQIEGEKGVARLKTRLKKYYPDVDLERL